MISMPKKREMLDTTPERRKWPREHYAALIRRLQKNGAQWTDATPRAIGITSSSDGQGVSTVAANMAI